METQGQGLDASAAEAARKARSKSARAVGHAASRGTAAVNGASATHDWYGGPAQEHARLIDRFSHDVRGTLGAADGYAQLLELRLAGPLSDEQERDIERIRALLRAATALVEDVVHATQERIRLP